MGDTEPDAGLAPTAVTAGLSRLRRGSLAVLALTVAEYLIGMGVNLYVTVPRADHGSSLGAEISNGPAVLSLHAVAGLLLGLGALGVLVQSVLARHWVVAGVSSVACFRWPSPRWPGPVSPAPAIIPRRWRCRC